MHPIFPAVLNFAGCRPILQRIPAQYKKAGLVSSPQLADLSSWENVFGVVTAYIVNSSALLQIPKSCR